MSRVHDANENLIEVPRILPRGRHGLGDDVVKQSQRVRMLEAMTSCCAANGYGSVSVADVLMKSGVSRKTFYEHFVNKEDCLIAAYDSGLEKVNERIATAVATATRDGENLLRATQSEYLDALADNPEFARLFAVEMLAGGPAARARRDEGFELFVSLYRALIAQDQHITGNPSEDQIVAAIGAVAELIRRTVSLRGPKALSSIKESAADITWTLLSGLQKAPE